MHIKCGTYFFCYENPLEMQRHALLDACVLIITNTVFPNKRVKMTFYCSPEVSLSQC